MSHAACLVVLDAALRRDEVEAAIAEQMKPFSEDGAWFRDGSRWDWYMIGGRFSGTLDGYDPEKDPRNIERCDICGGSGDRATARGEPRGFQHPSGCNGCLGRGRRVKWPTRWAQHDSDVLRRRDIPVGREILCCAFLRNREWHEGERMGWFGGAASVEGDPGKGEPAVITMTEPRGVRQAKIVNYGLSDEEWQAKILPRLLADIHADAWVAIVDYRV